MCIAGSGKREPEFTSWCNDRVTLWLRLSAMSLVLAAVMLTAVAATASLWVDFEPSEASPGAEVTAATIGQESETGALANLGPDDVVVLYLGEEQDEIDGPASPEAIRVGQLEIDQAGHGRLTFTVPDIGPGSYVAYMHCQDCSFDAEGLSFAPAGAFEVAEAELPATGGVSTGALAVSASLLLAGVVIAATTRTGRRPGGV